MQRIDAVAHAETAINYVSIKEERKMSDFFQRFSSFDALYAASYQVCKGVRWKDSTIIFEENRLEIIFQTQDALRNGTYEQLPFNCFSIIERGKPRDIRACHIIDRLVQNALCEQVLIPVLTPQFVYDNSATLKGKGIDFTLKRVKQHLRKARHIWTDGFYILRGDVQKYFDSIDHESLKVTVRKSIKDNDVYNLICYIIDTFAFKPSKDKEPIPGKEYFVLQGKRYVPRSQASSRKTLYEYSPKSLGLGSQTSQLLALLALNNLDHYIKEQLHIKYYGRYMDDFYLIHNDKQYLKKCQHLINAKLNEIHLSLNIKKTIITKSQCFKFLKWKFCLTDNGRILMLPENKTVTKQKRKMRKQHTLWLQNNLSIEEVQKSYQGWSAHKSKGNTHYLIRYMDNYFKYLFKGVEIV